MKRKFLILISFVFIISIAAVSASDDLNQSEILESADNFSDLQIMIDNADEGATINLENDYINDGWEMGINKSITINGNGYTLDGNMSSNIFYIVSDNVELRNMTLINGFVRDGYGGAICINANNMLIRDCYFRDNGVVSSFGSINGGAIYASRNLTIINCVFENNMASGIDGYSNGGAVSCGDNLTIINSTFISNSLGNNVNNGGAIYSTGTVNIFDSNFIANSLSGQYVCGGAVYADTVNVNNSVFKDNSVLGIGGRYDEGASSLGGAVFSCKANVYNSVFTNNSASIMDENQVSRGGAIYAYGTANVEGSDFTDNSADYGEAIWAYAAYANVENCTFTNNDYALVNMGIDAPALDKYYHGPEPFRVYLTDDDMVIANANVSITINGRDYVRTTNENGIASMAINLNSGKYDVTVRYENSSVNSTITVKPTVSGENITKIFRNATQYYATFIDSQGKTLANNTEVEFNINGVFYKRYTNEKGTARMNINLNPGEYIITAKNPSTGEQYTNVITVLPSIVENHDLVKYYRDDSQYSVKILGDDGNPVGANVGVEFNINGVFYTRYTDESGYAKLNINLEPGDYVITAQYNGLRASNNITVLPVIENKNLFSTLQRKIDAAAEGDTIYLDNDVIRGIFYVDAEPAHVDDIYINKSITIDGQGHTIDACSYGRVFQITSDNVTLKNITFINGYVNDVGSAIYNAGDNLLISDCNFRDNVLHYFDALADEGRGGAICTYGNMTVADSVFENNIVLVVDFGSSKGGAIYSNASLTVRSSEFKDNAAEEGSAIWAYAFNADISGCSFTNNDVALIKFDPGMKLNINQTLLKTNESIEIAVSFFDNVSGNVTVHINDDERVIDIVNNSATLTLSDLTVGAYDVTATYPENEYFKSAIDTASFRVLGADCGTFADLQKIIDNATAGDVICLTKDYARGYGDNYQVEINKSITLIGDGHVICGNGNKIFDVCSDNVTLENITFTGAYSSFNAGGAVAVSGNNAIISSCQFIDNMLPDWADLKGGALFIEGTNALISDCYFKDNRLYSYFGMSGGAVYCNGDLKVINSIFKDNYISSTEYAGCEGGAICCVGNLTVVNSSFISNLVSAYVAYGGAIYATGTVNITDSLFTGNELYGVHVYGGAVRAGKVFISDSIFEDNYILGSKSWDNPITYSLGGAVSAEEVNIRNSNFTNNSASSTDKMQPSRGGAVYSSGICNIDYAIFENNSADKGDSVWAYLALSNVTNSSFVNNNIALVKAFIEAPALAKMYHGSESFKVYLTEDGKVRANADVNINLNGKDYVRTTDEDGIASMAVNLNSGEYNVTVTYGDASADSTITVMSTVSGADLIKTFGDATPYHAIFYGTDGYILAENTEVEFNINGVLYKRYTNDEGVAFLNINLNPGEYEITAKNPVSEEMHTNTVTVQP